MNLRYMIDMVLRETKEGQPVYEPVGAWVQGPGPGLDIEMFYIDSRDLKVLARKEEANWVINRLVENDATSLPGDFLEYHRQSRSAYDGAFTEPAETKRFSSLEVCVQNIWKTSLVEKRNNYNPDRLLAIPLTTSMIH